MTKRAELPRGTKVRLSKKAVRLRVEFDAVLLPKKGGHVEALMIGDGVVKIVPRDQRDGSK